MSTPEGKVKDAVKSVLKLFPQLYQFWPVQMGMGATTLDSLICHRGGFLAIETKKEHKPYGKNTAQITSSDGYSGWVTSRQKVVATAIINAGGKFYLVDTKERARELFNVLSNLES